MKRITAIVVLVVLLLIAANPALAQSPNLKDLLLAARQEVEWPGLDAKSAAAHFSTPEEALRFVRDAIATGQYRGSFHGADGTLRTRVGNNIDKAVLLSELLKLQGFETNIVAATLKEPIAPHRPAGIKRPRPAIAALVRFLKNWRKSNGYTPSITTETVNERERIDFHAIDEEVEKALGILRVELRRYKWRAKRPQAINNSPSRLVWVRARKGNQPWQDFDVYSDLAELPSQFSLFRVDPVSITFTIEVVESGEKSTPVLVWETSSHKIAGFDLQIEWSPVDDRILYPSDVVLPLDIKIAKWTPMLRAGPFTGRGAAFALPKASSHAASPLIRLCIEIESKQGRPFVCKRTLHDLGDGFDQHEMLAMHRIGMSTAGIPRSVVEARLLDELHDIPLLREFRDGKSVPKVLSAQRGISSRTARVVNKMISTAMHIDKNFEHFGWQSPAITLETTKLAKKGDKIVSFTLLDILAHAFAPKPTAPAELKLRWGLAVCAAEASLVQGKSVNQVLLAASEPFQVVKPNRRGLLAELKNAGALILTRPGVKQAAWAILPDGTLKGVISERSLPEGKGSASPTRAVNAASAGFEALGGAAFAAGGGTPAAPLIGGVAGYFRALRSGYRGIAGKIEEIAVAIETGDVSGLSRNSRFQRDMVRNLLNEFGQGWITGYITSGAAAGFTGALQPGAAGEAGIGIATSLTGSAATLQPDDLQTAAEAAAEN